MNEISFSTTPGQSDLQGLKASYDSNSDNVFNAADTYWGNFRVWKDANSDALVDAGELLTLASLGITSISLVRDTQSFSLGDGSNVYGWSTFVMNGVTRQSADLSLAYNETGFTNFHGYGTTPDEAYRTYTGENGSSMTIMDGDVFSNASTIGRGFWIGAARPNTLYWDNAQVTQGARGTTGGDQFTVATGYTGETWLYGADGNDTIYGGAGRDVIDGGALRSGGRNTLYGYGGDDTFYFNSLDGVIDTIGGGTGYDTAIFVGAQSITINLGAISSEAFVSNFGNDYITVGATGAGAFVDGRAGNDAIVGDAYDDALTGGLGNDTIYGYGGYDLLNG